MPTTRRRMAAAAPAISLAASVRWYGTKFRKMYAGLVLSRSSRYPDAVRDLFEKFDKICS